MTRHARLKARAVDLGEARGRPCCTRPGCESESWVEIRDDGTRNPVNTCMEHTLDDRERRRRSKRQLKRARMAQVSWL